MVGLGDFSSVLTLWLMILEPLTRGTSMLSSHFTIKMLTSSGHYLQNIDLHNNKIRKVS
jgi:hypothetical protein